MEVRIVKTEDFYDTMKQWWEGQNFPPVAPAMLPEITLVCYNGDLPIYSTCFYNTDSNLCWLGWQIANPNAPKELKKGGLKFLFDEVEKYARYRGYMVMFTTSNTPSVEAKLKETKFNLGDENVNHYVKIL